MPSGRRQYNSKTVYFSLFVNFKKPAKNVHRIQTETHTK